MRSPSLFLRTAMGCGFTMLMADALQAAEHQVQTRQDLKAAMQSEARAIVKYRQLTEQAKKDGNNSLAALYERIAASERSHLDALENADGVQKAASIVSIDAMQASGEAKSERAHLDALANADGVQSIKTGLADATALEYREAKLMYSKMAERADAVGDKDIAKLFRDIAVNEDTNHQEFLQAFSKDKTNTLATPPVEVSATAAEEPKLSSSSVLVTTGNFPPATQGAERSEPAARSHAAAAKAKNAAPHHSLKQADDLDWNRHPLGS
jgi:rubrerythrin